MRRNCSFPCRIFLLEFLALFSGVLIFPAAAQQKTLIPPEFAGWLPISDAERTLKGPVVEKDAGAEVLLWRVRVVDEILGTGVDLQRVFYNYVRVKVFDQKGEEKVSTVDLTYREPGAITSVSGRTIKADGTIIELDRNAIHKRDLIRAGRAAEKAVSFSMPGVEPGSIIEYRWRQIENDNRFRYVRLHFQRDLPVEKVTYYVKPLTSSYVKIDKLYMQPFHCQPSPIQPDNDGWSFTSVENLPALRSEPYSPSEPNLEQWVLLYYRENETTDSKKYWNDEGKKLYQELKASLKTSDELKAAARQAVTGAASDGEKIDRLTAYLWKNLRQLGDPDVTSAEVQEYIAKLPKGRNRTSVEIFKSGIASPNEMNVAFAALAMAAGIDARTARIADRTEIAFNPKAMLDSYFLDGTALAIQDGGSWKFVDVSRKLLAPGSLPWEEEGVFALITDPKESTFVTTPIAPASASLDQRNGHFRLAADGGLAGNVEEEYTGHRAEDYRSQLHGQSAAQQEEWFRDRVSRVFPKGDMTQFQIENAEDPRQPLRVHYHVTAPAFAQVTGKRLLFQPNVFRRAQAAPFTASERKTMIEFPYAWKEVDQIQIILPAGFSVDNAENPGSLNFGASGSYKLEMSITQGTPMAFNGRREFSFGEGGALYVDPENYAPVKKIFDVIRTRDTASISLKVN
jgi:Domain of Unknown Function with PDB structure (DUF3857)